MNRTDDSISFVKDFQKLHKPLKSMCFIEKKGKIDIYDILLNIINISVIIVFFLLKNTALTVQSFE